MAYQLYFINFLFIHLFSFSTRVAMKWELGNWLVINLLMVKFEYPLFIICRSFETQTIYRLAG